MVSEQLQNKGIFLQPIFIGDNSEAVKSNREIFGRILACPDLTQLTPMIRSWLRALF